MSTAQRRLILASSLMSGAFCTLFVVWFAYAVHPAFGAATAGASAAWYVKRRASLAAAAATWGGSPALATVEPTVEVERPVLA